MSAVDADLEGLRREVIAAGVQLLERRLVAGTAGNIAARTPDGRHMLVTPSGLPFSGLVPDDLVLVHLETGAVTGRRRPSVELPVYLRVMRERPDVMAALHTHSTCASAVAACRRPIPAILDSMAAALGGSIDVAAYAASGSQQMAANVLAGLGGKNATLMANHGVFVVGGSLQHAISLAEFVEKVAQVFLFSQLLGGPVILPPEEVERERRFIREQYGQR